MRRNTLMPRLLAGVLAAALAPAAMPDVALGQSVFDVTFFQDTSASDGVASGFRDTLRGGLVPGATRCLDPELGEAELPPRPPVHLFDVRFTDGSSADPCLGEGTKVNYLPEGPFQLEIALEPGVTSSTDIVMRWGPFSSDAVAGPRVLYDLGGMIVNMELQDSVLLAMEPKRFRTLFIRGGIDDARADRGLAPGTLSLRQNYPNPFNGETRITYEIPAEGYVTLAVSDLLGREVSRLVQEWQPPGEHRALWDAAGVPSGLYLCRLVAGRSSRTMVMILLK